MGPSSVPFEDLTNVKLLLFCDDISGVGEFNPLVHIHVKWDSRLTPNKPDQDMCIKEALTDFRVGCESPHPVVKGQMKVTGRQGDWRGQPVEHAEYVETEALEQRDDQDSITKCEC